MPIRNQPVSSIDRIRILRLSNTIFAFSSLIALGFIIIASVQNARLKHENEAIKSALQNAPHSLRGDIHAQVGDLLASFGASDMDGNRRKVVYDGRSRYLLFLFSPECPSCVSEFPTWNKIALQARDKKYTVLGVSTGSVEVTRRKVGALDFHVVSTEDEAVLRAYRLERIPMVVLTSAYGRVEWLNYGPLKDDKTQDLLSTLVVVQASPTDW